MKSATVAVIGHVDHGKTLLVNALTGVDTDTLKDEKARGLSITLGFAGFERDDCRIHLIDAPGHADFTRMTVAGLSGASAILLVVSARDGIQNQTIEHVKLAHFFGIQHAVVAITKTDLVDAHQTNALREDIAELLSDFEFQESEIVHVSGRTHAGIDALAAALTEQAIRHLHPPVLKGFFLPVDRVFSADGSGTVVTGTLLGGALQTDAEVCLLPLDKTTSVRGLQIGGATADTAPIGTRVAVNVRGIEVTEIRKGDVLCAPEICSSATRFDVRLTQANAVKHMQKIEALYGTTHAPARVRLYPTEDASLVYAQLEFERPQVSYQGQRFILRDPASRQTLVGGKILDPDALPMPRNKAAQVSILKAAETGHTNEVAHKIADRDQGLVDVVTLTRLCQSPQQLGNAFEPLTPKTLARVSDREALQSQVLSTLSDLHAKRPCRPFIEMSKIEKALRPAAKLLISAACDQLLKLKQVRALETKLALSTHDPLSAMSEHQRKQYAALEARTKAFGLRPQTLFECPSQDELDLIECLTWKGRIIRLYNQSLRQTIVLHADAITEASNQLARTFPNAQSFTTGAAREALATNRKTVVPLLEYFDETGRTRRVGNERTVVSNAHPAHN